VEGFGFVSVKNGKLNKYFRSIHETEAMKALYADDSPLIIFHHRNPSSTPNIKDAAHPIKVSHKDFAHDYYVIHNGVINNASWLKEGHEKKGIVYTTEMDTAVIPKDGKPVNTGKIFNDSEALAVELALYLEEKQDEVKTSGSLAFICLETEKDGTAVALHYGRNHASPLVLRTVEHLSILSSEGEGTEVTPHKLYTNSMKDSAQTFVNLNFGNYYQRIDPEPKEANSIVPITKAYTYPEDKDHTVLGDFGKLLDLRDEKTKIEGYLRAASSAKIAKGIEHWTKVLSGLDEQIAALRVKIHTDPTPDIGDRRQLPLLAG